jgi:hypothetical protein
VQIHPRPIVVSGIVARPSILPARMFRFAAFLVLVSCWAVAIADTPTGAVTQAAPALTARVLHTATLLPSGRVFVVGGDAGEIATAEIYDPVANSWTFAAPPPRVFRGHTATLLPGNRVLLVGGFDGNYPSASAKAALYDAGQNAWVPMPDLNVARRNHTATLLPDGRVVIVGADINFQDLPTVELLNITTMQWAPGPPLQIARSEHTATLLPSGKILVVGGVNIFSPVPNSEVFDPIAYGWSLAAGPAVIRRQHTATLLDSGKVRVLGGYAAALPYVASSETFDPATGTWSVAGPLAAGRYGHRTVSLPSGALLVAGGSTGNEGFGRQLEVATSQSADFAMANLTLAQHFPATATRLPSGKVLILGNSTTAELFDETLVSHRVTITSTFGDYGIVDLLSPQDVAHNDSLVIPVTPQPAHSILVTGTCGGNSVGSTVVTAPITGDCTVHVQFPWIEHVVTPVAGAHGTIQPNVPTTTTATNAQFIATADPHYHLSVQTDCDHHTVNGDTMATIGVSGITHDCTVNVSFAIDQFAVTTNASPGGTIVPASQSFDYGATPTITITPDPGYAITAASTTCATLAPVSNFTTQPIVFAADPIDKNCSVNATFQRVYTVTPAPGPHGSVAPGVPFLVLSGGTRNLVTSHEPGYFVSTVSGCGATLDDRTVVLPPVASDCTLSIAFEYNQMWRPAGDIGTYRYAHTATLLPSGRVLIAGGVDTASAMLYDPASNAWTPTGAMATARWDHVAVLLASGKVMVIGGCCAGPGARHKTTEIFDPLAGTWSAGPDMAWARAAPTATKLPSGRILVTGGDRNGFSTATAEVYDPALNAWSSVTDMGTARAYHAAALLPNGEVLVAGAGYGLPSPTTEIYNVADNLWRAGPTMSGARERFDIVTLPSGDLLLAGGCATTAQRFDVQLGTLADAGTLVPARRDHGTIALPGGRALVAGGWTCTGNRVLSTTEIWFPDDSTWGFAGRLSDGRAEHTTTALADGRILVAGGVGDARIAEIFDPAMPVEKCNLDVDGDGGRDPLTDGLLILRYMAGTRDDALVAGVLAPGAQRADSAAIEAMIAAQDFDIDGDGVVDLSTDGTLLIRHLAGFTGSALIDSAVGAQALRTMPVRIAGRMGSRCITP